MTVFEPFVRKSGRKKNAPTAVLTSGGYIELNGPACEAMGVDFEDRRLVFGINRALRQLAVRVAHSYDPPGQISTLSKTGGESTILTGSIRGNLDDLGICYHMIERRLRLPLAREGDWWVATIPANYWPETATPVRKSLRRGGAA